MAGERSLDDIQREIERRARRWPSAVDQLAYRTSPKRVVENAKQTAQEGAHPRRAGWSSASSAGSSWSRSSGASASTAVTTAVLLISCRGSARPRARRREFVLDAGGNILHAEQHIDREAGVFFQRVEFDLDETPHPARTSCAVAFAPVAERFGMDVSVRFADERPRIAILASKQPHCLADLLGRWRAGELPAEIVAVISNHPDHAALAEFSGVPVPSPARRPGRPAHAEAAADRRRSPRTTSRSSCWRATCRSSARPCWTTYPNRIINIHHSFLPAFVGARPYHQAQERGVKLIGATAHYATRDLDEGPIIAQDVAPVQPPRLGRRTWCARDVTWRPSCSPAPSAPTSSTARLVFGNKTIVFG